MGDYVRANHRAVIHVDVCFHFPSLSLRASLFLGLLLSPLCQSRDWKLDLGMNSSRLAFFLFCPHSLHRGALQVRVLWRQKHGQVTHDPTCFSFPTARICAPCGYTFKKKIDYFLFCKEHSPKADCKYGLPLYTRMWCPWRANQRRIQVGRGGLNESRLSGWKWFWSYLFSSWGISGTTDEFIPRTTQTHTHTITLISHFYSMTLHLRPVSKHYLKHVSRLNVLAQKTLRF